MDLGINLSDYQNGGLDNQPLFDNSSTTPEQLAELSKALEAKEITGMQTVNSTTDSGAPLKTESLERNLKLLTFKDSDIRFWKRIPKSAAYNTVEEYNQLKSYGADAGGFNNEGELPQDEDSVYVRRAELVKFLGVTKSVTHPMQLVNTMVGNIMQREVTNGINWILRKADRGLFWANSDVVTQEWRGLYQQHEADDSFATLDAYQDSDSVIDLRGAALTESPIETAAESIIRNFGYGNLLVAPPVVLSNFVKSFYNNKYITPNTVQTTAGIMGQRVQTFQSQFGEIALEYDIFAKKAGPKKVGDAASSTKAPTAVTVAAASGAAVADADNRFAGFHGDYNYLVTAKNRFGESSPTLITLGAGNGVIAVAAGESVDLDFTDGGGTYPATGYVIYRTEKNVASATGAGLLAYPIFEISKAQDAAGYDGAAAGEVRDRNRYIPKTEQALLVQGDNEVIEFKQLAPLMKMDLAVIGPAKRFMILMYGTPMLYAPKKMVRLINIGAA